MANKAKEILKELTVEEKIKFCSGLDFWRTVSNEAKDIPSIMMADGPHGLRKQPEEADHLGIHDSVPSTCFPSGAGLASTWNKPLIEEVGEALGKEAQAEDISIVLGPGVNIKRSPLCGRNFEYYSEDPYLTGEIATSFIKGIQGQGVGTSLKHFAVNNQETRRITVDAQVDERTLREIYLPGFEKPVKEAQPWTIMSAYNKVNGTYASNHKYLLEDILREEWGFEGFVVSDWGAVNDIVESIKTGLELEMPSSNGIGVKTLTEAYENGSLTEEEIDQAVERILHIVFKVKDNNKLNQSYDKENHHQLAREVAAETAVLLKNDQNILPLIKEKTIGVIGELAKNPRFQGGGSSHINPTRVETAYDELSQAFHEKIPYAAGYDLLDDEVNDELINEAVQIVRKVDIPVVFIGLPDVYESEGYDREHMNLPASHNELVNALVQENENIVVVLSNGSPIEMPWINKVKAVLEGYLGGQASGGAITDLLIGKANPSGKLAETFPLKLEDNPSYLNFPGEKDIVNYAEGLFVGYRYYDTKNRDILFPFGHGLSYTTFEYTNLTVDKDILDDTEKLKIDVTVKNTGNHVGKEIIQLYVKDKGNLIIRPEKELKGFEKVSLDPGETKTIKIALDKRAFAYYDTELKDWHVQNGEFDILVGASSRDIRLKKTVTVHSTVRKKMKVHRNTTIGDVLSNEVLKNTFREFMPDLKTARMIEDEKDPSTKKIMSALLWNADLRSIVHHSGGKFTEEHLEMLINQLNESLNE